jgi:hypothetical protein
VHYLLLFGLSGLALVRRHILSPKNNNNSPKPDFLPYCRIGWTLCQLLFSHELLYLKAGQEDTAQIQEYTVLYSGLKDIIEKGKLLQVFAPILSIKDGL